MKRQKERDGSFQENWGKLSMEVGKIIKKNNIKSTIKISFRGDF